MFRPNMHRKGLDLIMKQDHVMLLWFEVKMVHAKGLKIVHPAKDLRRADCLDTVRMARFT